ncbi:hypothetical protein PIIN_07242 [Serendipita indica DSM 11827]|uniref:Brl1/Brr6 domain-containing protein n=1 Tax=Serendipita indica (strain DSM 11827) TaxID=1109443 RepID=G4TPP1_SERID|nr:hypothetical protein PIIN_07242 [Serendipita indica DSM 11827]
MSGPAERRWNVSPMDFEYTSEDRKGTPAWAEQPANDTSEQRSKGSGYTDKSSVRGMSPSFVPSSPSTHSFPSFGTPSKLGNSQKNALWRASSSSPFSSPRARGFVAVEPIQEVSLSDISMEDANASPLSSKRAQPAFRTLAPAAEERTNLDVILASAKPVKNKRGSSLVKQTSVVDEPQEETDEASSGEEHEEGRRKSSIKKGDSITSNHHYTFNMPTAPAPKSEVPYLLLGYVQFLFNLSLVLVFLYVIVFCILTVQRDVEHRMTEYRAELAEAIATCAQLYEINKCFPLSQRVPAIAKQCSEWETCMQRDPLGLGRSRVVAETIGEVINSFVEPISWKTLIFGLVSLGFLITLTNILLSTYRERARVIPENVPLPQPLYAPPPPIHPHYLGPAHSGYLPGHPPPQQRWTRTWSGSEMIPPLTAPTTPSRRKIKTRGSSLAPDEGDQ